MKLSDIAFALDATLENGNPETEITGVAGIEEAAADRSASSPIPSTRLPRRLRPPRP